LDSQTVLARRTAGQRRYNLRCPECLGQRVLGVVSVVPGVKATIETGRLRPDPDGNLRMVPSRPKVKWAALPDGRQAVRCPCGMGAIIGPDELALMVRQAMESGAKDIVLS
jgi:hypothetical protein